MKRYRLLALLTTFLIGSAHAQTTTPAAAAATARTAAGPVDPLAPIEKVDASGKFRRMHEAFLERGKAGPIGVLFLGDSITEGWSTKARHIWAHYYDKYQPANFGIGGDQTHHVIWRIENGEFDGIKPKVVVLMIGTNNSAAHSGEQIAAANRKIIEMIHARTPETKILLLAIFPRGPRRNAQGEITPAAAADAHKRMAAITLANAELAKLDNGSTIRYLDIGATFLGQDGRIPWSIMPDQLHPTAAGYQLWADAIKPTLDQMMK